MKKPSYNTAAAQEAEYFLGWAAVTSHDLNQALAHYYRADELSRSLDRDEEKRIMALTNIQIGKVYEMQNKSAEAFAQYRKVIAWDDYDGTRSLAQEALNKNPKSSK
jgi:tetratricopeptide (TPR) repeat protein